MHILQNVSIQMRNASFVSFKIHYSFSCQRVYQIYFVLGDSSRKENHPANQCLHSSFADVIFIKREVVFIQISLILLSNANDDLFGEYVHHQSLPFVSIFGSSKQFVYQSFEFTLAANWLCIIYVKCLFISKSQSINTIYCKCNA